MKKILGLVLVVVFCLTFGTVVPFAEESEVVYCGYLKDAAEYETEAWFGEQTILKVLMFDEYGNRSVYDCAKEISINGVIYTDTAFAFEAIAIDTYAEFTLNSNNEIIRLNWNTTFPQGWQVNVSVEEIELLDKTVTAKMTFNRIKENCIVLLAVYNDGVLINVAYKNIATTDTDLSLAVNTGIYYSSVEARLFFWNSFEKLAPLVKSVEKLLLNPAYKQGQILAVAAEKADIGRTGFEAKVLMNTIEGEKVVYSVKDRAKLKTHLNEETTLDLSLWEDLNYDYIPDNSDYLEFKALEGKEVEYIVTSSGIIVEIIVLN